MRTKLDIFDLTKKGILEDFGVTGEDLSQVVLINMTEYYWTVAHYHLTYSETRESLFSALNKSKTEPTRPVYVSSYLEKRDFMNFRLIKHVPDNFVAYGVFDVDKYIGDRS